MEPSTLSTAQESDPSTSIDDENMTFIYYDVDKYIALPTNSLREVSPVFDAANNFYNDGKVEQIPLTFYYPHSEMDKTPPFTPLEYQYLFKCLENDFALVQMPIQANILNVIRAGSFLGIIHLMKRVISMNYDNLSPTIWARCMFYLFSTKQTANPVIGALWSYNRHVTKAPQSKIRNFLPKGSAEINQDIDVVAQNKLIQYMNTHARIQRIQLSKYFAIKCMKCLRMIKRYELIDNDHKPTLISCCNKTMACFECYQTYKSWNNHQCPICWSFLNKGHIAIKEFSLMQYFHMKKTNTFLCKLP